MMSRDNVTYTLQGDIRITSLFQSQNDVVCKRHFDVLFDISLTLFLNCDLNLT